MKFITTFWLALALVGSSGCASMSAIDAAKGDSCEVTPNNGGTPRTGSYSLLPLTVPLDIATLPLQGLVVWMFSGFWPFGEGVPSGYEVDYGIEVSSMRLSQKNSPSRPGQLNEEAPAEAGATKNQDTTLCTSWGQRVTWDQWLTWHPFKDVNLERATYSDPNIVILWGLRSFGIELLFQNKTDEPVNVLWSEAYVTYKSQKEPLVCASFRTCTNNSTPRTRELIPKQTTIAANKSAGFSIHPRSRVRWQDFTDPSTGGFWQRTKPLFELYLSQAQDDDGRYKLAQRAIGKDLQVFLPLEIHRQRAHYLFQIRVNEAKVHRSYYP